MRDLLFDVPAAEPHRRTWTSVFDIPPGTLAEPTVGERLLYVTSMSTGWWVTRAEVDATIPVIEGRNGGWPLLGGHNAHGPFREVL